MSATVQAMPRRPGELERDSSDEQRLRVELAAAYRIIDHLGWTSLIYNHITARVPGPDRHFLINPYGLMYGEITASSLVKIDIAGTVIEPGVGPFGRDVNPAGFTIHAAIHAAREDAHCVVHTHTVAGCAVSAMADGLLPLTLEAMMFYDRVAYHDFEGVTVVEDEGPRLVRDLGDKRAMILRNHGLLTCGPTVSEAIVMMWGLERACQMQAAAMASGAVHACPPEVAARVAAQTAFTDMGPRGQRAFDALVRTIEQKDPSYKD
jgi:ribulose-5-phosphate 4-epimerase/fuculose-1-phosphate aldolase